MRLRIKILFLEYMTQFSVELLKMIIILPKKIEKFNIHILEHSLSANG